MSEKFEFTAKHEETVKTFVARVNALATGLEEDREMADVPPFMIANIIANHLIRIAAERAVESAEENLNRKPKKRHWRKVTSDIFNSVVSRRREKMQVMRFVLHIKDSMEDAKWEQIK